MFCLVIHECSVMKNVIYKSIFIPIRRKKDGKETEAAKAT